MTSLGSATTAGSVTLLDHSENWSAARHWVDRALESADVAALSARALELVKARRLLLPDAETLIERVVVGLLGGHVVLTGPPGTGKTTLTEVMAEAFGCSSSMVTATADWSAYDVIGGLQPKVVGSGDLVTEVLVPWLGHVSRAAVRCADVIAQHEDDPAKEPNQAHWLIIDEFSRAEIDKAIGPLYTALSGQPEIPLWFADAPERAAVWLPHRFRILATMNSVDTAYVFTFSQGLTRRFQFVHVGVPELSQLDEELERATEQAVEWYQNLYGSPSSESVEDQARELRTDPDTEPALMLLRRFVEFVRYGDPESGRPGWPLGTAQLVDVLRQLVLRRGGAAGSFDAPRAVDLAIADRMVPQMSELLRAQIDAATTWLNQPDLAALERTRRALAQLREAQNTVFA